MHCRSHMHSLYYSHAASHVLFLMHDRLVPELAYTTVVLSRSASVLIPHYTHCSAMCSALVFFFFFGVVPCLDIMDIVFFPLPTLSPRSFFSLGLLSGYISFGGVRLLLSFFLPLRWEVIILYLAQNRDMFAFHA